MRLPSFYALDIRIERVWQFRRGKMTGYLDIANVSNASNPASINDNSNFTQSQFNAGLPILSSSLTMGSTFSFRQRDPVPEPPPPAAAAAPPVAHHAAPVARA